MNQLPIYYLNLASAPARRDFMEGQFARLGLRAERIEGLPAGDISADMRRAWCDPKHYFWLTPNELGANLSHLEAMRRLLAGAAPFALIFEDDAVLSPALPAFLAAFTAKPPAGDLLKLETFDQPLRLAPQPVGQVGDIALRRAHDWSAGAAGYIVSRHAAQVITSHRDAQRMIIDEALFNPFRSLGRRLQVLYADPALCIQRDRLPGEVDALPSSLNQQRQSRAELESRLGWRLPVKRLRLIVDRDLVMGSQKVWRQLVRGARKERIAFRST